MPTTQDTTTNKTIVVVGATGLQGFSVARTFAALPHWHVRGLTRDPSSAKARALADDLGCEVVQADLGDAASLARAFAGAHAIFLNTDFWGPYRARLAAGVDGDQASREAFDAEVAHGRHAVAAAAAVPTLERLVYSALGPMKAASGGKYPHSYHWETKARIVEEIEQGSGSAMIAAKTSFVYLGAYATNPLLYPKRSVDAAATGAGEYKMVLPCQEDGLRLPIIDAEGSTGPFVRALVESEAPGTKLLAYDSYLSVAEILAAWSRVTGRPASFVGMTIEEMNRVTGIPAEVLDGPAFIGEFGYTAGISNIIEPNELKAKVVTPGWEEWLKTRDLAELLETEVKI